MNPETVLGCAHGGAVWVRPGQRSWRRNDSRGTWVPATLMASSSHAAAFTLASLSRVAAAHHRPLPEDSELVQPIAVLAHPGRTRSGTVSNWPTRSLHHPRVLPGRAHGLPGHHGTPAPRPSRSSAPSRWHPAPSARWRRRCRRSAPPAEMTHRQAGEHRRTFSSIRADHLLRSKIIEPEARALRNRL